MNYEIVGIVVAIIFWTTWTVVIGRRYRQLKEQHRLPPGPSPWPVVGNIFQLARAARAPPHQSLAKLAQKYGPLMTLHLGSMTTVVISSSQMASVMFKDHDVVLAGRKIYESMKGGMGNVGSLITAQYGPHWRILRRMCTVEFFAAARLDDMRGVRAKCVDQMVQFVRDHVEKSNGTSVDVGKLFFLMSFNLIGNLMFSKDLLDPKSERGAGFFYHAKKVMEYAGKPNVADFIPILRWIDPQGIRRRTQFHVKKAADIVGEFLEERMIGQHVDVEKKRRDYVDVLLQYRDNGIQGSDLQFSPTTIKIVVFEMFMAGTDTTTSTLEWAMAELLHNPHTLRKVQAELRTQITQGKTLEEQNLNHFPYLNAVIKETLRLHPPLPFLVPHMAMDSCVMIGFHIPKETQILVNVWAIGRDPHTWNDPLLFKPERFLGPDVVDFKGQHFEFIPFGSGRRMCPAVPLASRFLPLALGSVLHSFDWVLENGIEPAELDMSEKMGITLRKAVPLKAIPVPYAYVSSQHTVN